MIFGVTKATIPAVLKPSCLFSKYCSIMRQHPKSFTLPREEKLGECSLSTDAWSIKPGFLPLAVFHASEEGKNDKKNYREIIINLHFYNQSCDTNLGRKHSFLFSLELHGLTLMPWEIYFYPIGNSTIADGCTHFFLLALFSLKKKKKVWFASLLKSSF